MKRRRSQNDFSASTRQFQTSQSVSAARNQRRNRRGSWLVQAIITMSVMSVLMTLVATALFRMYRQEALMVERTFETSTWLRLSRDFRHDMHTVLMIKQSDDGSRLELVTSEGPVTWLVDGEKIHRTTQQSELDNGADPSTIASLPGEQYVFVDSQAQLSLDVGTAGAASVAKLEVTPLPTPNRKTLGGRTLIATAGLDHRFLTPVAMPEDQP